MAQTSSRAARPLRRPIITIAAIGLAVVATAVALRLGTHAPAGAVTATASPLPSLVPATIEPTTSPAPSASLPPVTPPPPTAVPLVAAPLTGVLVRKERATRHPIAVMVDDHPNARTQAGFNAASVVWHAPAEGGVPRYMLVFQETIPTDVGPIRSARQYYVEWAAELNAMYVHHGGSPQALETLHRRGNGSWVYNADGFRWENRYVFRAPDRFAPHNVMTDGKHLRKLAALLGADDGKIKPFWSFGPDAPPDARPTRGMLRVVYPYETVTYRYDPVGNRYVRYIDASKTPQVDTADDVVVAPKNVVILRMHFGALNDNRPDLHRLEAHNIGKGEAWISSNGVTVKGTWRKASVTSPTRLFGPDGEEVILAAGQTFIEVIALTYDFTVKDGPVPAPSPSGATAPGGSSSP